MQPVTRAQLIRGGMFLITLASAMLFLRTTAHTFFVFADEKELSVSGSNLLPPPMSLNLRQDPPAELLIPAIDVRASVEPIGIAKSGNMAVPVRFANAGWYRHGASPGNQGSMVMAGHVDTGFGTPAVFSRLGDLTAGDEIIVLTLAGKEFRYIVLDTVSYPENEVPMELLVHQNDRARLNLITCDGAWNSEKLSYERRLVVFAELAS